MGNAQGSAYQKYIKESSQSSQMAEFSAQTVSEIYPKHKHFQLTNRFGDYPTYQWSFDEQEIMDKISQAFVNKFGGSWTCIAGSNASYGAQPRPTNFIRFDIDETGVGDLMNNQKCFCRIIIYQN